MIILQTRNIDDVFSAVNIVKRIDIVQANRRSINSIWIHERFASWTQ